MTTDLSSVTGVRQSLAVILPVRITAPPPWPIGPIPFDLGSRRTDAATRQTYFNPAAARALYGTPERPCRWHRFMDVQHETLRLRGIELLRTATAQYPPYDDIAWTLPTGPAVLVENFPHVGFNKIVTGVQEGQFSLCAVVQGVEGCLHGEVIP